MRAPRLMYVLHGWHTLYRRCFRIIFFVFSAERGRTISDVSPLLTIHFQRKHTPTMPLHVDTSSGVARAVDAPVGGAPAHPWERVSADSEAEAAPAAPQPKADTPSTRTNTQVSVSDVVSGDTAVHVPVGTRVVLCGLRKYSQFNGEVAEVTGVKGKYALVQAMGEVLQLKRIHYREPTEAELRAATFSPTPTPSVSQVSQKGNSKPAAHPSTVASGSDVRGGGGGGGEVESRGEREGVAEAGGEEGEGLARQDSASQNLPQVALTENVSVRMQPGGDKVCRCVFVFVSLCNSPLVRVYPEAGWLLVLFCSRVVLGPGPSGAVFSCIVFHLLSPC